MGKSQFFKWENHNFFHGKITILNGKITTFNGNTTIFSGNITIFNGNTTIFSWENHIFFMGKSQFLMPIICSPHRFNHLSGYASVASAVWCRSTEVSRVKTHLRHLERE
jgi:hypothetical protein